MSLNREDLAAIFAAIDGLDFVELTIELPDFKLAVSRAAGGNTPAPESALVAAATPASPVTGQYAPVPVTAPLASEAAADGRSEGAAVVTAPMLGTFYRAPKPGDRPYCEVGDKVLAGDVLGLVEVMKMMNRVITPVEGEVHLVLAEDGALVEFGQELFEIIPGEERPDPETAP